MSAIQKAIVKAALAEKELNLQEFLGKSKGETTKCWSISVDSPRAIIDIYSRPVVQNQSDPFKNDDIRTTKAIFAIKYVDPLNKKVSKSKKGDPGKPYRIIQDLTKCEVGLSGPAEFHKLCQELPEFQWLYENTNYTDELFAFAKRIPGYRFEFTIDWSGYNKRIKDEYGEEYDAFTRYYCDEEDYGKLMYNRNIEGKIKIKSIVLNKAAEDEYNTNIKEYKERLKELTSNE